MEQFIKVGKSENAAFIQMRLVAHIVSEDDGYVVDCPSLGVVSQGDNLKEAKANFKEAVELLIATCLERGTLAKRLARLNAYESKLRKKQRKPLAANFREVLIPTKISLTAAA